MGRHVIKLAVAGDASKTVIRRYSRIHHLTQQELAGRVFDWFGIQDRVVQESVLGEYRGNDDPALHFRPLPQPMRT